MAKQRSPDGRLVYLHCSSIFSGANAHVRRVKKVSQLLEKHKASIKILTKEFTLPAVAAVAKELLEEQIFESLPRAKLRYPELFQPSETQEAERAALEAEVIRIEAEAAQDIVLTSDDEGGDECLDFEQSEQRAEPEGTLEDKAEAGDNVQISAVQLCQQSTSRAQHALSIPRLHPVYLPFKTQHRILVPVQFLLEECCLEFGNTWVPDLMEARKWNEAESIELTEWTKRFLKYAKSLPPSAIKPVPGRSIAEVLFGTSTLRHSAVHRLPTSAAGILNMLSAAITFAEALNDSKRAEKIAEIKTQLEASIEEIVQHQNLLERKLTDQFEDIARRRAELDELERSSIEEMLAVDKKQRTEVGSAFESFLVSYQRISNPCTCSHTPSFDGAKTDSKAEENIESSWTEHELKPPAGINEAQVYNQSPLGEEKSDQGEKLEKDNRPPCHDNSGGSIEEEPEVSELTLPTFRSSGQKKNGKKAAASGWGISAAEEAPVLVDEAPASEDASPAPVHVAHDMGWEWPRKGFWNFGATSDVPADPHNAAEEAIPAEEPCFAAPEGAFPRDEPYIIAPEEEPLAEDAFPGEAISKEDPVEMEKAAPEATLEASQPELIIEGFDDVEEHPLNQYCHISHHLGDPYEPTPEPDVAPIHGAPAEDAMPGFRPPPPSAPSSTVTSILEAAAPEAPTKDSHTITLKILNGSKVLRSIVFIRACTRTAILNEARAYCVKRAQDDQSFGRLLAKGWDLALVSLKMYGYDMDLSTYKVENLSSLVRTVEKTGIPRFTLRISEI
ncbi:hypothetical protein OEA41_004195 [Lepraria neglecta]|uniref:Uncharacterized protein n=1 Tax=Lepraria neglecta TaxID=209136 RepID=A0AAD9Z615_9LECA|nr:hypothetical protein OEA41_004195 [Lepraria neglecta]